MEVDSAESPLNRYQPFEPEGDLVLPPQYDATELFDILDSENVVYDPHRSEGYYQPILLSHQREFIGMAGVRRFIRYRRAGLLPRPN